MQVVQTSSMAYGQIYIPVVNWLLFVLVVAVVAGFGESTNLAAAYGLAVTGTMLVTTLLTFFVIHYGWGYGLPGSLAATGVFVLVDAAFFSSSLLKITEGGWFPLALGGLVFIVMLTWVQGRRSLLARVGVSDIPLTDFLAGLMAHPPTRVPGTAVFLNASAHTVPHALLHNLNHNRVLHERLVFLTVRIKTEPWVPFEDRMRVEPLGNEAYASYAYFRFQGPPRRACRARRAGAAVRAGVRADADLVFPEPRNHRVQPSRGQWAVQLARTVVPMAVAQCRQCGGILQSAREPGDRTRFTGGNLSGSAGPTDMQARMLARARADQTLVAAVTTLLATVAAGFMAIVAPVITAIIPVAS